MNEYPIKRYEVNERFFDGEMDFIGEVRLIAGDYPPRGYTFCNGAHLNIRENRELYMLLGNRFGGDGRETFALPHLQGRGPVGMGENYYLGHRGGAESLNLEISNLPPHKHDLDIDVKWPVSNDIPDSDSPEAAYLASGGYYQSNPNRAYKLSGSWHCKGSMSSTGERRELYTMGPYQVLNYVIRVSWATDEPNKRYTDMNTPNDYLGAIRMFAFDFVPEGYIRCTGQVVLIAENPQLYSLLGNNYGGDGKTTFALPDLRGRFPVGYGLGRTGKPYYVGETGGSEEITLEVKNLPGHRHDFEVDVKVPVSTDGADTWNPQGAYLGTSGQTLFSVRPGSGVYAGAPVVKATMKETGLGKPIYSMPPYTVLNICMCIRGVFPPRY